MPIDAFVCRMPTLGVPYDLYLISYTSNTAKGHWLLGVHHCPGLGYFALLHKSTCFIHRSEATAPGERTAGGCPGRPQPRFGGHGDAGTRRGEPLISDKRKRVATIHHRYKLSALPLQAHIGLRNAPATNDSIDIWPLKYEILTEQMQGRDTPPEERISHIRGDSVLDTSDHRDLYSYSDDEITSHPHGPHLHPPEDDSYYNPTPKRNSEVDESS
ncbi:uncharacterized protein [Miscanthus floridulus]|uniref:uncharacterized protein isoform X1 n=1 Tax=Miscanthus floridulus TaxID=154761 RepID=UPI0034574A3F